MTERKPFKVDDPYVWLGSQLEHPAESAGLTPPADTGTHSDTARTGASNRPSAGAASAHVYVVSDSANADGTAIYDTATGSGLLIDGIELRNISRTGIHLFNKKNAVISDCDFRVIGGIKPASLWIGNGLELSKGCNGVQVTASRSSRSA